jgi:hypothetical protein
MKKRHVWDKNRSLSIDPEVAGRALDDIYKKQGKVRPGDVVEASRSKNAPLHEYFEWNNAVAAEQYRLQQARQLINHMRIEFVEAAGSAPVVERVWFSASESTATDDGSETEHFYIKISDALDSEVFQAQVSEDILRTLMQTIDRTDDLLAQARRQGVRLKRVGDYRDAAEVLRAQLEQRIEHQKAKAARNKAS